MTQTEKTSLAEVGRELESKSAEAVCEWVLASYGQEVALASSFGAEDVVLIDMLVRIEPKARVFTLDTGRLHQETYEVMEKIREKYGIKIEVFCPEGEALGEMLSSYGVNLFYQSVELRKLCCTVRKVEPLKRALSGLSAWICGLRREQAVTRSYISKIEVDEAHGGILKINPLADWTEEKVWAYIKNHDVPYNALHDKGFASIGCVPCTRAVSPGEDIRAGRWWWESPEQKECGLHEPPVQKEITDKG